MAIEKEIGTCISCPYFRAYDKDMKTKSYSCIDDGVRYFIETPNGPPFHARLKTCRLPITLIPG